jgi:scyllo-inositol 2-dehydrogenase (NAD+)
LANYRTAIVGLSWIATDPAPAASDPVLGTSIPYSHAAALAAIPGIDVVAGCDIVPGLRDQFLERWRGHWPNARVYESYAEMLSTEKPDLVCIATPDFLHADPFIKAVEAGAKGIFVEKPLATSLADATRMVEAGRAKNVVVNVDFTRRWMPNYVTARALVDQGRIGKLSQVIVEIGGERAMLWRNHPHAVDLMAYYAAGDPEWVFGELEQGYEHYGTEYKGDGGKTTSSEPAANYYVAFRNGIRGYLTGMKDTLPGLIVTLRGATGRIQVDEQSLVLTASEMIGSGPTAGTSVPRTEVIVPHWTVAGMEAGIRDVITGLETGRPTAGPTEDAWRAAAILDGVVRSQAAGNTPARIDPPSWAG